MTKHRPQVSGAADRATIGGFHGEADSCGFVGAPLGFIVGAVVGAVIAANWVEAGPGFLRGLIGAFIGAPVGLFAGIYVAVCICQFMVWRHESIKNAEFKVLLERAFTEWDEGNWDQAVVSLTEVIRLNPALAEAYRRRAIAYLALDKLDSAIADCNHLIEIGYIYLAHSKPVPPYVADAYVHCGTAFARKGEHDRAIAAFTEAIHLAPGVPTPYKRRAHSRRAIGDAKGAGEDELEAHALASP
jgi:tetratricopeptide (TPR) repeat protein